MTLQEAIAELRRTNEISAPQDDEQSFFAVIWRAVASGDLIPATDLVEAEAPRKDEEN